MKIPPAENQRILAHLSERSRPHCRPDCPICGGRGTVAMLEGNDCHPIGQQPCPRIQVDARVSGGV